MENYIIRIYRHEKDRPQRLVGVVETVGEEGKKAFTQYEELWDILNAPRRRVVKEDATKRARGKEKR